MRAVALLAGVAIVVRLPMFLSTRWLSADDGVYGASVVAMRHGLLPYRDVFSSQGPLHLPLLYAGDLLGFHMIDAPRVTPLLAGVITSIAVWGCASRLRATPAVALVAGLMVATTGTMLWATGQITADGPAAAFTALAVWAALCYRDDPRLRTALLTGALFGGALSTKPIVGTAAVPIAYWMTRARRPRHVGAAALTVGIVWFASALPWGLSLVWNQSIAFHTGAGPSYGHLTQLGKLLMTLATRDPILVVAVVLGGASILFARARRADGSLAARGDATVIAVWVVMTAIMLVFEKAMFANHIAAIVLPLALLFACRPPPLRWLALVLVVLVPWEVVNQHDILRPLHITGADAEIVATLRTLPPRAEVIADEPGLVWRAGRSTPALMNDMTNMRVLQGDLTTGLLVAAAAQRETCALVIKPSGLGWELPGLADGLRATGYLVAKEYPGQDRVLWLKRHCDA